MNFFFSVLLTNTIIFNNILKVNKVLSTQQHSQGETCADFWSFFSPQLPFFWFFDLQITVISVSLKFAFSIQWDYLVLFKTSLPAPQSRRCLQTESQGRQRTHPACLLFSVISVRNCLFSNVIISYILFRFSSCLQCVCEGLLLVPIILSWPEMSLCIQF